MLPRTAFSVLVLDAAILLPSFSQRNGNFPVQASGTEGISKVLEVRNTRHCHCERRLVGREGVLVEWLVS